MVKMYLFNLVRLEKEIVANLPILNTPELWGKKIISQATCFYFMSYNIIFLIAYGRSKKIK